MSEIPPTPVDASASCEEGCSPTRADADRSHCPISRTLCSKVDLITVKALLKGSALRHLTGKDYYFCPAADCDVVYFDGASNSTFRRQDLVVRVGRKESEDPRPVCYCFDFTVEDLSRDITSRGDTDIPEKIAEEVRAGHCACEVKNPEGSCCLGTVRKAVRKIRSEICLARERM